MQKQPYNTKSMHNKPANLTLLIVEDDFVAREALKQKVQTMGHQVSHAVPTGAQALEHLEAPLPHAVLMDIHLQGDMDGVETARAIWQKFDVPVLFITSIDDQLTRSRAAKTGRSQYLTKPVNPAQLAYHLKSFYPNGPTPPLPRMSAFDDVVFLPQDKGQIKVAVPDILYLKSAGSYCQAFMVAPTAHHTQASTMVSKPLNRLLEDINQKQSGGHFMRVARSFAVNMGHVVGRQGNELVLVNGTKVLVGTNYRQQVWALMG